MWDEITYPFPRFSGTSWSLIKGTIWPSLNPCIAINPILLTLPLINSLRPRPNRRHFADDVFKRIFENENEWISPGISLTFVPKVRINNIPALFQIMAWHRPGDKPLSEPMMVCWQTHICVTRPQWVKEMTDVLTNVCTVEVLEGISNFMSHFTRYMIIKVKKL